MRPRLLDVCCGAGGAAKGYHDAGFDIVGVDLLPQKNYPFAFIQADALEVLKESAFLAQFDAIHASPPCQRYSVMLNHGMGNRENHPDLVSPVRELLQTTNKPYIIENVPGAPLIKSITLCGAMFGLRVYRHRWFESNVFLFQPAHPKHKAKAAHASRIPRDGEFWSPVGCFGQKDDAQRAMGIDWMKTTGSRDTEIAQAIPPAYTEWIGQFLLEAIEQRAALVASDGYRKEVAG